MDNILNPLRQYVLHVRSKDVEREGLLNSHIFVDLAEPINIDARSGAIKFSSNILFDQGEFKIKEESKKEEEEKQNNQKTKDNLTWLRENTGAHLHTDLIFGLPSDTLDNFGDSFNQLLALNPHEIQMGILKRLRGAPLNRHNDPYQLRFNPEPPYNILTTLDINFNEMQRVNRFARFWDMLGNSGRFSHSLPLILTDQPFKHFMKLSDSLYIRAGSSWKIALKRLFELVYVIFTEDFNLSPDVVKQQLAIDYARAKLKGIPDYERDQPVEKIVRVGVANKRQLAHL